MGPGVCLLLIQTLAIFWATRILNLIVFICLCCLDPKFLDFQTPESRAGGRAGQADGRAGGQSACLPHCEA